MCVPTAEPYVEPTNDVDTDMAKRKLNNGKADGHGQIPTELIKEEEKSSRRLFMNSFQTYGGKR
jgi:hypothetical protein